MVPFFLLSIPKLGHELHSAASNYQSYGKIEGERRGVREE